MCSYVLQFGLHASSGTALCTSRAAVLYLLLMPSFGSCWLFRISRNCIHTHICTNIYTLAAFLSVSLCLLPSFFRRLYLNIHVLLVPLLTRYAVYTPWLPRCHGHRTTRKWKPKGQCHGTKAFSCSRGHENAK